jgi:DHA2 family multidrug resistance protein
MSQIQQLIGLLGVLIAAIMAELNDQVTSLALTDIRGALGISHDPGEWIDSLYLSASVIGMALSPWFLVTFSLRRFTIFAISLNIVSTLLIPFSSTINVIYLLRLLQGLAGGLTIPLLMTTALRVTPPSIRLYGLAVYALTATVTPGLALSLAALWTDVSDWRFIFLEMVPLGAVAAALAWFGLPQDPMQYARFRLFDWRGALLIIVGFGALTTMLMHGDRLDWFNSPLISTLLITSIVAIPLLLTNEFRHPLPFLKLQMLARRNFAYGPIALFAVLIIGLSATTIPLTYLTEVQGYRPLQSFPLLLEISAVQLVMLPLMAVLLNIAWIDARVLSFFGLTCILAACIGDSFLDATWNRDQFYLWQGLQAIGQPMVVVPLLMIATNAVRPPEGPFAAALVNTPRALAEVTGAWLFSLILHWRGALHTSRLSDQIGQNLFRLSSQTSPPQADIAALVQRQALVLSLSDAFLVVAAVAIGLMVVLLLLPVRTLPPRLQLSSGSPGQGGK